MMKNEQWDDDSLLSELGAALREPDVPPGVLDAAKAVYTWRTIDIELAGLAYDSAVGEEMLAGVRGEAATLRTLSFEARDLTIEIGITPDALIGQFVPAQEGTVEVHALDGVQSSVTVDDAGCFFLSPVPSGPFRLAFTMALGGRIVTDWVTL